MKSLASTISQNYFQGYAYSYPHKSAYRELDTPRSLASIWAEEDKRRLFLYVHVPFCEMRCGFCNLFTIANPKAPLETPFIGTLQQQAAITQQALGNGQFARVAIGGGTPTFLKLQDLEQLFDTLTQTLGANLHAVPMSVESSPKTITPEKLALLKEKGTTRVSMGVQSFFLSETKSLGRPQENKTVHQALQAIKDSGIPEMNIDLIYGMAEQTVDSWQESLRQTLVYQPEEIFLYPLYVRPLTGLGRKAQAWNDHRLNLYRAGRDFLLQNGYKQVTMRIFRRENAPQMPVPPYNSPEDGMVGLGVGARSYTRNFHYSSDYAVGRKGVKNIIHAYHEKSAEDFQYVDYGVTLPPEEQRRRYVIKSLLEGENLNLSAYQRFFGTEALTDLPELHELFTLNLAQKTAEEIRLNAQGLELSDVIGPWLYSEAVQQKMKAFELV